MGELRSSNDYDELVRWAESQGGYCSPSLIITKSETSGSTAHAKTAIEGPNARLLSCPTSLIIDYDKAAAHIWEDPHACPFLRSPEIAIRLFLCNQRILGRDSPWAAYIKLLPTEFDTPLYYSHDELEMLRGTNVFGEVELRRHAWVEEWKRGVMHLPSKFNKTLFSWELYLWACTVLSSRSFPSSIVFGTSEVDSYPVLVPLVDSLNHKPQVPVYWNATADSFTISSGDSIAAGDEVFNNYGLKGNEELLMGYGFCLENNPFDVVTLKLRHPRMSADKAELVSPEMTESIFHLSESSPLPHELVNFFRIVVANVRETERLLALRTVPGLSQTAGMRCELDALGKLYNAVSMKLRGISVTGVAHPNKRQQSMSVYISRQVKILSQSLLAITRAMYAALHIQPESPDTEDMTFLRTKVYQRLADCGVNLDLVFSSPRFAEFTSAIKEGFDVSSPSDIRAADIEDQILVLFVSHLLISTPAEYSAWADAMHQRYNNARELDEDYVEDFERLFDAYIPPLAELNSTIFGEQKWTPRLMAWAGKVVDSEGVVVENCEDGRPEYWIITAV
ncbi:hypothetical protein V1517DRAFT_330772 [Lipomyces orientalis]|uniref:Uncharacterized protein n=1 Tax=Lipomyces orientalis TaxID=1233043 RepID=A0ACC3TG83_9ASCO